MLGRRGTLTTDDGAELVRLFSKHCLDAWARAEVRSLSEQILTPRERKCHRREEVGAVGMGRLAVHVWVRADADHSPTRVSRLLDAVSELTDRL